MISNKRKTVGNATLWLLTRKVRQCEHSILVEYRSHEDRSEVARHIWRCRRQIQIAVMQQKGGT